MSQAKLILGFVDHTDGRNGSVAFSKRGKGTRSYVNVFGPDHDPSNPEEARIVIEHDGAIRFKDVTVATAVASALGGKAVLQRRGVLAPGTGAARMELPLAFVRRFHAKRYRRLVLAIVSAMNSHASWD